MQGVPDFSTQTVICSGQHVRAIGWLSQTHNYPIGVIEPNVHVKLQQLIARWRRSQIELWWPFYRGMLECPFCDIGPESNPVGSGFLGVPSNGILYVLPTIVFHFIGSHHYLPPEAFLAAVRTAPFPGTEEYRIATEHFRLIAIRRVFPKYDEWKAQHPTFDGMKWSVDLLLSSDLPQGAVEYLTWEIYQYAHVCSPELIDIYRQTRNMWVKRVLIRVMSDACLSAARLLFHQESVSTDEGIRFYAQAGLLSLESE